MEIDKNDNYVHTIQPEFPDEINRKSKEYSWLDYCERVTMTALPFIALNKTLNFPVSLIQHTLRGYKNITELLEDFEHDDCVELAFDVMEVVVSIISIAGTIFLNPLGTVISKGYQTAKELFFCIKHFQEEKIEKALENLVNIFNNVLYFILLAYRICELIIISLVTQILLKAYQGKKEFVKERYIECTGKILMAAVRMSMFSDKMAAKCTPL